MVTIHGGKLAPILRALTEFKGRKGVPLSVKLANMRKQVQKYHDAWREEELIPAIRQFNGTEEASEIDEKDFPRFLIEHESTLLMPVEVPIEPIQTSEFGDEVYLEDDLVMDLLLEQGVVIHVDS